MIIDAQFIISVAKLAIQLGEHVIVPMIHDLHSDKSTSQKEAAVKAVKSIIDTAKAVELPAPRETK